ncbi:MAG: amidohydrolase [Clostridia bacterium]|nr:amidohydrolase [Clostridia bacterium]
MNFKEKAQALQPNIVEWRRDIHMHPEVSFKEFRTSQVIKDHLTKLGIEILPIESGTSVVGLIRGSKPGKTFAMRADFDALPMQEEADVPFKSVNDGVMHSCGHDTHAAMLMGVAQIMNEVKDEMHGNIKLIFQAAEEMFPGGAKGLVEAGVLENPKVDAIMAYHIGTGQDTGKVTFKPGASHAAPDKVTIKIIGLGGHGAGPHRCIDPVAIAGNLIVALQNIVSRNVDPLDSAVVTIGAIHGGTKENIIADDVTMLLTVRTLKPETREFVHKRIKEICDGVALSHNAKIEVTPEYGYPALFNDADFVHKWAIPSTSKIIGEENIELNYVPTMGGEDMSYYLQKVPGLIGSLGARNEAKGCVHGGHNSKFMVDEDAFWIGTASLCQTAWDYLNAEENI